VHFDVPGWLASVVGCTREELEFDREREVQDFLVVTYTRAGKPLATVNVTAVPLSGARRASWQLAAEIGDRLEQVQLPSNTRFVWR
jgi:hypothetical protein